MTSLVKLTMVGFVLLAAAELAARMAGLHKPLLYLRTDYGYRVKPSQDLRILGNTVLYNSQGLRAPEIAPHPPEGSIRVLCVGDSITNGGTLTDQPKTYPYILAELLKGMGISAETLNGSANGWALENQLGWLKAHGIYHADFVVLQVATHDLFQRAASSRLVDLNPSFPSRAPVFGLETVLRKAVLPRLGLGADTRDPGYPPDVYTDSDVDRSLRVLERIRQLVVNAGAVLVLMPVEQPRIFEPSDPLTLGAKARLRRWAHQSRVPVVETSASMNTNGSEGLFRDPIHPNNNGNALMARLAAAEIGRLVGLRNDRTSGHKNRFEEQTRAQD
ncbi:MAG: SGNH/GDSL hydrolase family protein [Burkholderiales bacterium]|nr:SGNH/GDSL hydrolase family protein [Burkholderiales bacterium]